MTNKVKILDDSVKSTLFGKFYEDILRKWFAETKGYKILDGKPRVYWKNVPPCSKDNKASVIINNELKKYKKNRHWCTPDGIFERSNKFFIWEAKNWPQWTEGKDPLNQLRDHLLSMPMILANKAVYNKKEYELGGVIYSWWSEPEGFNEIKSEIDNLLSPRSFDLHSTLDILEDCIQYKYSWYLEIINREKDRTNKLFQELLGEQNN